LILGCIFNVSAVEATRLWERGECRNGGGPHTLGGAILMPLASKAATLLEK